MTPFWSCKELKAKFETVQSHAKWLEPAEQSEFFGVGSVALP